MHLLRNILAVILVVVSFGAGFTQNEYNIDIQIENATSDTLYLSYFYLDRRYVRHTGERNEDQIYTCRRDEALSEGVYMSVMPPSNSFLQVLIDWAQTFSMTTDAQATSASTVI